MKRLLITVLQALITIALLYWIFRNPEKREVMLGALQQANWGWLIFGTFLLSGMAIGGTERWRVLLRVQNIHIPRKRIYELFMIGLFFNLFLPGGTGGDLIKIFYTMREASKKKKAAALLSVVIDRIIGLLALFIMALIFGVIGWKTLTKTTESITLLGALLVIMIASLVLIIPAMIVSRMGWINKLPPKLPMRERIIELVNAFDLYGRSTTSTINAFLLSFISHSFMILSVYCAARAFTDKLGVFDAFLVVPIIITISALPLSIAGLGVRETLSEHLLQPIYGIPNGEAVLISIASFFMIMIWSIAGGVVYMLYRPPEGANLTLSEMQKEVSKVEEEAEEVNISP